ncbi:MAG: hypothetical protein KDA75_12070 [Planctomycetaceae bacterium]|nr:hypothetical protein [Planctomycetaceae bacterium]
MNADVPPPMPKRDVRSYWPALVVFSCVLAAGLWRGTASSPPPSRDRSLQVHGWADEQSCSDCHEQALEFSETGHARTLHRAEEPELVGLLKQLADEPAARESGVRIDESEHGLFAVHHVDGVDRRVQLDWCFGSGHHARTWGGVLDDSWGTSDLLEFRWTWYSALERFGVTPGQPADIDPSYFGGLGLLFDHPKARRCFGCHATRYQLDNGHLIQDSVVPGVTCQRCHGPRATHVASEGEHSDFSWRGISQLESVHRCAECHRRAEEQKPEDIREDNPEISRFQPVGLLQSPCFQRSPELTCITCHDPHRPMSAQDSRGDWQCIQCHDGAHADRPLCGAGESSDCLRCHMPKVESSIPIRFTDHWIRIRDDLGKTP